MIDFPTPAERSTEARRLLKGLVGQWVADRMRVSKTTISKWKRGERIPDLEDLLKLPEATDRPLDPALRARYARIFDGAEPGKDLEEASG